MGKLKKTLYFMKETFYFIKTTFLEALKLIRSPGKGARSLYGNSLYRNAVYLIANSAVTAILGSAFWIVVARFYSSEDVGLGSALISAAALLSFIGTLGLGYGVIRFLSGSVDKARLLNFSFTVSLLASVVVAGIFLIGLPLWSPKLMFARENPVYFGTFVIFIAASTFSLIVNQVFVAFRRSSFTLANSVIANVLRLALAAGFASLFRIFGIFSSWGVAVAVSSIVCLLFFLPRLIPGYRPIPNFYPNLKNPDSGVPRQSSGSINGSEILRYSLSNYIGSLLGSLPTWILPLMVLNVLSAEANAHFYISWTIASFLLAIPIATSTSFFAEGSHTEEKLAGDFSRSLKLLLVILVPAVIILVVLGDKLLLLFGREYSAEGAKLLWFLAPAALPASINLLYIGIMQVKKKLREIVIIYGAMALGTLLISYLLLPGLGILGTGVAWLVSQTLLALVLVPRLKKRLG